MLLNTILIITINHLIYFFALLPGFNNLLSLYELTEAEDVNFFLVFISYVIHVFAITLTCFLFRRGINKSAKRGAKSNRHQLVVICNDKINIWILILLSFQLVIYIYHYGSFIGIGQIDVSYLMGLIAPLFPGQIGIFFVTIYIALLFSIFFQSKFLYAFSLFCAVALLKKYMLIFGLFILFCNVNKFYKLIILGSSGFFFLLVDAMRNNMSELSFGFSPFNYVNLVSVNFIGIWRESIFASDFLYLFKSLLGGEYIENAFFLEPTAGPGYVGAIFITGNLLYGGLLCFFCGVYIAFLMIASEKNEVTQKYVAPLFYFGLFQALQGNVFFHPLLFIIPFVISIIFSKWIVDRYDLRPT
jgi:hypothetical protein